jgi:hypothetical protein
MSGLDFASVCVDVVIIPFKNGPNIRSTFTLQPGGRRL